jgi:hypothetical protein
MTITGYYCAGTTATVKHGSQLRYRSAGKTLLTESANHVIDTSIATHDTTKGVYMPLFYRDLACVAFLTIRRYFSLIRSKMDYALNVAILESFYGKSLKKRHG